MKCGAGYVFTCLCPFPVTGGWKGGIGDFFLDCNVGRILMMHCTKLIRGVGKSSPLFFSFFFGIRGVNLGQPRDGLGNSSYTHLPRTRIRVTPPPPPSRITNCGSVQYIIDVLI